MTYKPLSCEDRLTGLLLKRNPAATEGNARKAAKYCIAVTTEAMSRGALPSATEADRRPCETYDLYLPGSEHRNNTQHDYDAIFGAPATTEYLATPGHVPWIRLNWVNGSDRLQTPLSRGWYTGRPACKDLTGLQSGLDCDEFPFYSSAQSGPTDKNQGGPEGSLRPIDARQNRPAGRRYQTFAGRCELLSGGPIQVTQGSGTPFLVLPMAFDVAPNTMEFCKKS